MSQVLGIMTSRFTNNTIAYLLAISSIGLIIRLYYFPHDIPLTLDTLSYFFYANDVSILGKTPTGYNFPNNGWPLFVSIFFSIFRSDNFLEYMDLQRYLSIIISVGTVVPTYLLCKKFVEKPYCLLGAALFIFDPRIIQNSLLGDTQPLFIFVSVFALVLFFSRKMKIVYISFFCVAILSLIRYEGILLILPFSIMYLLRFRREKLVIVKFSFAIMIFILIIIPAAYFRIESIGNDGLTSQVYGGAIATNSIINDRDEIDGKNFIVNGIINFGRYLGWVLIPTFIFFVPIGFFYFLKKMDYKTVTTLAVLFTMMIPAIYAYARDIQETRYLYIIFPIFCVFTSFTIKQFLNKRSLKNIFLLGITCAVIISSLIFFDYKKIDHDHEYEAYRISKYVSIFTTVINDYYPESRYIRVPPETLKFPTIIEGKKFGPELIASQGFNSLEQYITENNRLDHLVLDGKKNRAGFLNDVYYNEEKYPFLIKEFDSDEFGFNYKVKIFRIDYEKFKQIKEN